MNLFKGMSGKPVKGKINSIVKAHENSIAVFKIKDHF